MSVVFAVVADDYSQLYYNCIDENKDVLQKQLITAECFYITARWLLLTLATTCSQFSINSNIKVVVAFGDKIASIC